MWVSHDLLPMSGLHNNCGRPPPMAVDRSISSVIMIASLDPVSLVWPQPAALRCSKRLTMLLGPMRSVNGFWEVCVESALITCSSCMRSSSTTYLTPMSSTSTTLGRIKASGSRFQSRELSQCHTITKVARSSPSRSWAAYTMTIAEVPEFFQIGRSDCLRHARNTSRVALAVVWRASKEFLVVFIDGRTEPNGCFSLGQ